MELFRCKYNKLHLNCMNPFGELVFSSGRDRSGAGLRGPQRRACGGGFCPKAIFDPALSAALPHWYRGVFSGCAMIWASINVVNCTDGVDGLSASLAVVSIGTFLLAYWAELGDYATAGIVFIGALLAYLWQNAKPSTLLMGDAGSRAMGFFLAVLALKSSHPFAFLLAALVFIVDGSLGILKISFKRFLHISILKNTLTPLHDHVRKRLGWSDEQVVARWLILQAVASAWLLLLVR